MKKILSLILALLILITGMNLSLFSGFATTAQSVGDSVEETITVYFINNDLWEDVYIYSWNPEPAVWPGTQMNFAGVDASGFDIYCAEISAETEGIVFNNNDYGIQTKSIKSDIGDNSGWYISENGSRCTCASFIYQGVSDTSYIDSSYLPVDEELITVYFLNTLGWDPVYIYTWLPELAAWPGVTATRLFEDENGNNLYMAKISAQTTGLIFNVGSSDGKTVDIVEGIENNMIWRPTDLTDGKYNVESLNYDDFFKSEGDFLFAVSKDNTATVLGYTGTDSTVVIPRELNDYTVTGIAPYTFYENLSIQSVVIPDTVTEIGYRAFFNCKNLSNVSLSSSLEYLAAGSFENCLSLRSIVLPSSLCQNACRNSKGNYGSPFVNCKYLENVEFESDTTVIPNGILMDCTSISELYLPSSVETIGESAFKNCKNLVTVFIPNSVKSIECRAFENCYKLKISALPSQLETLGYFSFKDCHGITSMSIPKTLLSVTVQAPYYAPFYGCINLKEASFEYGTTIIANHIFESAESLESVYIPDTVTEIKYASFNFCFNLKSINIPDSVTAIGSRAFCECVSLTEITLPKNLEILGYLAFKSCTKLTSIKIPNTFRNVYYNTEGIYSVFDECSSLTEVVFEDGITSIPDHICENMPALKKVVIPDSVTSIGISAFHNCPNLSSVRIPEGVKSIGTSAFRYCTSLTSVILPENLETTGDRVFEYCKQLNTVVFNGNPKNAADNIFDNCNTLRVYCPKYSTITIQHIDVGNACISNNNFRLESCQVLDEKESFYTLNQGVRLSANVKYCIRDEVFSSISNAHIIIHVPSGTEVAEEFLYHNKTLCDDYTIEGNKITIPINAQSGNISIGLDIVSSPSLITYATLNYTIDGVSTYEIIDVINENFDFVTVFTEDIVSSTSVKVSGIAPSGADVDIYIDNRYITTLKANKAGVYVGEISLNEPENDDVFIVTAKILTEGKEHSADKEFVYLEDAPKLLSFIMNYNGNSYDLLSETKQNVVFRLEEFHGETPFNFTIKYENRSQIEKVYISSTRNQIKKTVEALWSEDKQAYVFDGYFDETDHDYIPGNITVSYSPVKTRISFSDEIDFSSKKYVNGASDPIKSFVAENPRNNISNLYVDDKNLSGAIKMTDANALIDFNFSTNSIPSYLTPETAPQYGYEPITDDQGTTVYMKIAENCEDIVRGEVINFAGEELIDFFIDGEYYNAASALTDVFTFVNALGYADTLVTWENNKTDLREMKHTIMVSDMSEAEKNEALRKLENAEKNNNGILAVTALSIMLTASGVVVPFPISLTLLALSCNNSSLVDSALGEYSYLNSGLISSPKFRISWNIDPSGYVYCAVTNNCISGATVTAYWIPYDEEDADFWDAPDESKAILWDSSEYSQLNPLITDNTGNYAWDVPEGWWQVKYAKEGYITTYSEWLPVPPPQTDVNIWMEPISSIESISVSEIPKLINQNGVLVVKGGKLTLVYDNGMTKTIAMTKEMLTDYDVAVQQKQVVTIEYEGHKTTFETEIKVDNKNAKLEGYSLSLAGNIAVNFFMNLNDDILADENAKVEFTMSNSKKQTAYVNEATVTDTGYYVFSCEVTSIEMTDTVSAQVIATDYESDVYSYSVLDYAEHILREAEAGNEQYTAVAPLVKAMLTYGANSQLYFGYETDNLANEILSDEDKVLSDVNLSAYKPLTSGKEPGVRHHGTSLTLKSETVINVYFIIEDEENIPEFYVNGVATTPTKVDNLYKISIEDIPAQNLDDGYVVTVGGLSVRYSAFSYGYSAMYTNNEVLKNVARAMYAYNQAAIAYLNTEN